jgi:hypothetical protein
MSQSPGTGSFAASSMLDVVNYRLDEIKAEAEARNDYIAGRPAFAPRDR